MNELRGIARFRIHEGKLDEFKRLSAQAMEIVQTKDPGTLQYDTYFNNDESECIVLERFRDSEALIAHAANLSDLSEAILSIVSVVHGELLGEPNADCERTWPAWRSSTLHSLLVDVGRRVARLAARTRARYVASSRALVSVSSGTPQFGQHSPIGAAHPE